ncbi:MAG: hypothetical protein H6711_03140 [Myxococcales bacterium]|nr:hypothetical protein [Myxococcales bacterium]
MERPSLPKRALARVLNAITWVGNGYAPPFSSELLRSYSLRELTRRSAAVTELAKVIEADLGERDGHLLLGFASLWNGCQVCALGHIYAGNLAHFRDRGELLAVDEQALSRLMRVSTDAELLEYSERCLAGPGEARILGLVRRLYQIKLTGADDGVDEQPGDSEMLAAAISAYDWINHCTIYSEGERPPLIAFSRLNQHFLLRARYAAARRAAGGPPQTSA